MKLIQRPLVGSQRCAATERTADDRGFIHTNKILAGWDQEVMVSATAAEEMGRLVGMVPKAQIQEIANRLRDLGEEIEKLREQNRTLAQLVETQNKVAGWASLNQEKVAA